MKSYEQTNLFLEISSVAFQFPVDAKPKHKVFIYDFGEVI